MVVKVAKTWIGDNLVDAVAYGQVREFRPKSTFMIEVNMILYIPTPTILIIVPSSR